MKGYKIPKEVIDFLYNGCVGFFPEIFFPEEKKQPIVFYFGLNKQEFENKIKEITNATSISTAVSTIREWKTNSDRGEEIFSTVPLNIEELIEFSEEEKAKSQKAREKGEEATKEFLEAQKKNPQKVKLVKEEIELTSPQPQTKIKLTREQQKIIAYAQADPQKFTNELAERIVQKSNLNRENPLEIESAKTVAQVFTLKLLGIDPKTKEVTIDSSPFEVLSVLANPENPVFTSAIPDYDARKQIAEITQRLAVVLEQDTTLATNWVNQATGVDWAPLFIPPQIRELKEIPEEQKGKTPGINVNLKNFLEQIASVQALERQIRKGVIDEKTYSELTRAERAKLNKEIKVAASKISSMSSAFSFLTKKRVPFLENTIENKNSGWLNIHFSAIGITPEPTAQFLAHSFDFSSFSSPNILNSPVFNFAFEKIIQKLPATVKIKSVVSGFTTKLTQKTTAKIAATKIGGKIAAALSANVIPVVGQIISAIATALSIKDIVAGIGKWIKKNSDKIPYVLAGILVGGFALTGAPLFLIGGLGIAGFASRAIIGGLIISTLAATASAVLTSLVTPMIIVFVGLPILVAIILFIINSGAYVYPPGGFFSPVPPGGGVGTTPSECTGPPPSPPDVTNVLYSQDGRFAFPVAPNDSASYHCYHWDHEYAADIFSSVTAPPVVAYTNGTVVNVTLDDPLGGKYVILRGNDGRYYYYAHNCHIFVKEGQSVRAGELLATMDATGNGRVQHLHFAINSTDYFPGGSGDVCPQQDFIDKFNRGCPDMDMLCR